MLSATLLPEPDRPLTTIRRTGYCAGASPCFCASTARWSRTRSLLLAHAAVELVRERVDRRVHVVLDRVRVNGGAPDGHGRFGPGGAASHRKRALHVDQPVEAPH